MYEQNSERKNGKKDTDDAKGIIAVPITEGLFVILPLVVLSIVGFYQNKSFVNIAASPEWAFGAAIFFGQAVVKLVQVITIAYNVKSVKLYGDRIVCFVAVLIVLGLVPSLIVLGMMLSTEMPSMTFIVTQVIMFVLALVCFLGSGALTKQMENYRNRLLKEAQQPQNR